MSEFDPGEKSLAVQRTFDEPRGRIWKAWTDPAQVGEWWGPDGFTTATDEMAVRWAASGGS